MTARQPAPHEGFPPVRRHRTLIELVKHPVAQVRDQRMEEKAHKATTFQHCIEICSNDGLLPWLFHQAPGSPFIEIAVRFDGELKDSFRRAMKGHGRHRLADRGDGALSLQLEGMVA